MPPKNQFPTKKRKRREHPTVEAWSNIATLAAKITKLTQQQVQFKLLLKQIIDLTQHDIEHPENQWETKTDGETIPEDIQQYINEWLKMLAENNKNFVDARDKALQTFRNIDLLDDEALKRAAVTLAETEATIQQIEQLQNKWNRIVRLTNNDDVLTHTEKWIHRFRKQWTQTHTKIRQVKEQFYAASTSLKADP